jgi:hypothetical protein
LICFQDALSYKLLKTNPVTTDLFFVHPTSGEVWLRKKLYPVVPPLTATTFYQVSTVLPLNDKDFS